MLGRSIASVATPLCCEASLAQAPIALTLGVVDAESDAVWLPLKKGRNELVLALSALGGGWGCLPARRRRAQIHRSGAQAG